MPLPLSNTYSPGTPAELVRTSQWNVLAAPPHSVSDKNVLASMTSGIPPKSRANYAGIASSWGQSRQQAGRRASDSTSRVACEFAGLEGGNLLEA